MELKEWLDKRRFSAQAFAALIGYTQPTSIYRILRGERRPSAEMAKAIEIITEGDVTSLDLDETVRRWRRHHD